MKKYARLRQECSEFDNALYDASPEVSFNNQSRPASSGGSASPRRDSPPGIRAARPAQPALSTTGASHGKLTEALKKLGSFREGGSRRLTERWQVGAGNEEARSRSASGRWPINAQEGEWDAHDPSASGRWVTAATASLSGRWGSVSTNSHWDDAQTSFRDSLSLSRSGRLMQEGEPWTAPSTEAATSQPLQRKPSVRDAAVQGRIIAITTEVVPRSREASNPNFPGNEPHPDAAVQQNISMRETQGWLASVKRPLQPRKKNVTEDPNEFNWRAATSTNGRESSSRKAATTVSQSMRYDRLKTIDLVENSTGGSRFDDEGYYLNHSVMQKAASMREGGAHSDAIMAMARAYSEKHGVQQAILECVSCGRGLGVIVQGNPGNDASFCQSCRPHAIGGWTYHTVYKAPESGKSKRKGMMNFCKKILRMGKKPNKLKGVR